jgi:hypothetical protein
MTDEILTWSERLGEQPSTWADIFGSMDSEIHDLRAYVNLLEKQEPVAWVRFCDGEVDYSADAVISNTESDCMDEDIEWRPVYLAPGAQPKEPSL